MNRRPVFLISCLCFGFAFFYIPILSMIVYSFNASRLATVWGGFSTKWYVSLFSNMQVIDIGMSGPYVLICCLPSNGSEFSRAPHRRRPLA